ncbi:D-Ala-D-Ala carboxypeptidase. Metallo peptidase. MEROPS family M15B [Terribacillus aidingensis]|uniref:D-Ala-D-Ala carboxypeptidase. Metallo peptidase. MEROPS family M15B n=1 Tax=Terribacillus aidingensis TaxID=586416 RepID=A0A285P2N1_9BACI|nr:M15 family metallopeptidase [Terribacillus aidingensis]SNZ14416.1 D-Ala-D-Ala carboxypeptidase. Metallo peptidase. MEROPS family M15B [Terribacillus aidingensis]
MKRLMLFAVLSAVLVAAGCQDQQTSQKENTNELTEKKTEYQQAAEEETAVEEEPAEVKPDQHQKEANDVIGTIEEPVTVDNPDSIEVVVNKTRQFPDGWAPKDLVEPDVPFYFNEHLEKRKMRKEAAAALEELFAASQKDGMELVAASGYRSESRQKQIYEDNVSAQGQEETDKVSARPGRSEHQSGLAIDLTSAEMALALEETFINTDEGKWLADHAYAYGFIVRYPKGKTDITGYSYEPWHIRYVGKDLAKQIHEEGVTLEEHFQMESDLKS